MDARPTNRYADCNSLAVYQWHRIRLSQAGRLHAFHVSAAAQIMRNMFASSAMLGSILQLLEEHTHLRVCMGRLLSIGAHPAGSHPTMSGSHLWLPALHHTCMCTGSASQAASIRCSRAQSAVAQGQTCRGTAVEPPAPHVALRVHCHSGPCLLRACTAHHG